MKEETLPMRLPDDVEELHLIAEYHTACRALRTMGWGGIVFGLINIGLGIAFVVSLHPINAVLALIGLFLLLSGVWCLVLPGAEGVITNGIALILVGVWNIIVTVLNLAAGANPQVWWAVFGVFLIAAAVQCFQKYARFAEALRHGVSQQEKAMMDGLVKAILKANAKEDEDIITFQVRTFAQQKEWRGQLRQDVAVFVEKMSKEVLVAPRAGVRITPHGKALLGKSLKATVKIRDHTWEALLSPKAFDRYRDWKFSADADESDRADERRAETGIRAKEDRDEDSPTGIKRRPRPRDDD
jgi:hypothetical protein